MVEEKILHPMMYTGRNFYLLIAVLLAAIAWFGFAYYTQLRYGLGVTGMNEPVYWGIYIASFIFFVGVAHGGIAISAAVRILKLETYRPIARMGEVLTVVSLILAGMMIIFDLGRPDRVLNLFRFGRWQSPLAWDVIIISAYFMASVTFMYLGLREDLPACARKFPTRRGLYEFLAAGYTGTPREKEVNDKVLWYMSVLIVTMIVLASGGVIPFIFGLQVAQPGWYSAIMPSYFVTGAITSASAAVIIIAAFMRHFFRWEEYIKPEIFKGLANFLRVMVAIYFYFMVSEQLTIRYAGSIPEQVVSQALFFGEFAPLYWSYIILGLFIPFFILVIPQTRTITGIVAAAFLVTVGLWAKRFLIVVPPLTRQLLPAPVIDPVTRQSFIYPPTAIGMYTPTWVEWSLLLGALAIGILLYTLFVKLFPMMELKVVEIKPGAPEIAKAVPPPAPEEVKKASSKCNLCGAEFSSMDECCEHAEKEHKIARASCDMCCEEVKK